MGAPVPVMIGVDVGTTAVKVAGFALGSTVRAQALREYPLRHPRPGWAVQHPEEICEAVLDALGECVASLGGAQVIGCCVSTAMHGLIGLDGPLEPDGQLRPTTPVLTWADSRAGAQAEDLHRAGRAADLLRRSGTPVHPMSPLVKLLWFAEHEPQLCDRTRFWVGLKELVLHLLTGELVTELGSASGTGLLELTTRSWSPEAVALAGIEADRLAPVLATTDTLRMLDTVATRVGLPAGTPVVLGAGDGPLGNLGCGALGPGSVGLSLGTSGALRVVHEGPRADPQGRLFCYALTDRLWVSGAAVSNGGSVVRWAGEVFGPEPAAESPDERLLLALAEQVPAGSDGLVMLPFLLAERAPLWNPALTGAFLGVRRWHTRGQFVRAGVEGVALLLAGILDDLHRLGELDRVRCTGGVFRSPLWRRVLAGMFDRPLLTGGPEGSALGAAALGLYALDRAGSPGEALSMLTDPDGGDLTEPDAADVRRYAELRDSLPGLLAALGPAVELVTGRVAGGR